ncbi:MAG: hypothetical protein QF664_08775 [Dehalococcoidia bacterium]|nr:hypothetical protein [Dehalococcoidia bacterium]
MSGTARGQLTGVYEVGTGGMSGIAEVEGSSSVNGCSGAAPSLPPPPAQQIGWSAVVDGNTIRGSLLQESGGVVVETPFQLTIAGE